MLTPSTPLSLKAEISGLYMKGKSICYQIDILPGNGRCKALGSLQRSFYMRNFKVIQLKLLLSYACYLRGL